MTGQLFIAAVITSFKKLLEISYRTKL